MQWVGFSFVWSRNCLDVKGRNAVYNFASFLQRSQTRDARDRRALHMTMSFFRICVLLYCAYSCDVRVIVSDYYTGLPKTGSCRQTSTVAQSWSLVSVLCTPVASYTLVEIALFFGHVVYEAFLLVYRISCETMLRYGTVCIPRVQISIVKHSYCSILLPVCCVPFVGNNVYLTSCIQRQVTQHIKQQAGVDMGIECWSLDDWKSRLSLIASRELHLVSFYSGRKQNSDGVWREDNARLLREIHN